MAKLEKRSGITADVLKKAGLRENTIRAGGSAIRHYEEKFLGSLPATVTDIKSYIVFSLESGLAVTTISQRIALLSIWHREFGFPDPTKDSEVKATLKGARSLYGVEKKQAEPLTMSQLAMVVEACDEDIKIASTINDRRKARAKALLAIRDKAYFLTGFWFAFRSDEMVRLDFKNISFGTADAQDGSVMRTMRLYLQSTKGDRNSDGQNWTIQEMRTLCPVNAMLDWKAARFADSGPVFVGITRWGQPSVNALHINSVQKVICSGLARAGIDPSIYSTHSLRRGFANYAISHNADARELQQWVKWKDIRSAIGYLNANNNFVNDLVKNDPLLRIGRD